MNKPAFRDALTRSLPVLCSYLFIGTAFGIMMNEAGYGWPLSALSSVVIYTGAFQFVLIKFLSSGASLITIALTALLMNSRQSFYSITFLKEFKQMGRRKLYMIHTMTDETYAVNCTLDLPKKEKEDTMFLVALFSRCYWIVGSVLGGILGQIIPFDLTGLDFCMTALFLIIFIDQWEKAEKHTPALTGLGTGVICLLIFGENRFMLPALLIVSALLLLFQRKENLA